MPDGIERETMSVEDAGRKLGFGRSASYLAAASGEMPGVIKIGRKLVVSRRAIERLLDTGNVGVRAAREPSRPY